MNNSTHFKSIGKVFTLLAMLSILFFTSCGGDDEATPDCSNLELNATAEGNTITVSATGGASPYVYSLDGTEQSGTTFTDLEPGSYAVVVTDANECSDTQTVTIEDPCVGFIMTASGAGYAVAIEIEEGEAPFSYLISYGDDTEEGTSDERSFTVDLEEAEETTITVTDANGCEKQASINADQVRTFTDNRDGQTYQTIKIGEQIWFAENFNYETEEDSYCYDNDPSNCETYGRLYTWEVAQNIVPEGWQLPSQSDFETLIAFLGNDAGTKIKVEGGSGFNARLAGARLGNQEIFDGLNEFGNFWSTTETDEIDRAIGYFFSLNSTNFGSGVSQKNNSLSLRLIK